MMGDLYDSDDDIGFTPIVVDTFPTTLCNYNNLISDQIPPRPFKWCKRYGALDPRTKQWKPDFFSLLLLQSDVWELRHDPKYNDTTTQANINFTKATDWWIGFITYLVENYSAEQGVTKSFKKAR